MADPPASTDTQNLVGGREASPQKQPRFSNQYTMMGTQAILYHQSPVRGTRIPSRGKIHSWCSMNRAAPGTGQPLSLELAWFSVCVSLRMGLQKTDLLLGLLLRWAGHRCWAAAGGCPMSRPWTHGRQFLAFQLTHLPCLLLVLLCCRTLKTNKKPNPKQKPTQCSIFLNEQTHKAAQGNQVSNKTSWLQADSCCHKRSPNQTSVQEQELSICFASAKTSGMEAYRSEPTCSFKPTSPKAHHSSYERGPSLVLFNLQKLFN